MIDKEKWKHQKKLADDMARGAKVAEQWVKLSLVIGQLNETERDEFDRLLDNLSSHIAEEIVGGQIDHSDGLPGSDDDEQHKHN